MELLDSPREHGFVFVGRDGKLYRATFQSPIWFGEDWNVDEVWLEWRGNHYPPKRNS